MEIVVTDNAMLDLAELQEGVENTFFSAKDTAEKNLGLGATPRMAFEKYLSGDMHPILQETLGRDYRAWFIEGEKVNRLDDNKIYCIRVLTAKEAHKIEDGPKNADAILESALG